MMQLTGIKCGLENLEFLEKGILLGTNPHKYVRL